MPFISVAIQDALVPRLRSWLSNLLILVAEGERTSHRISLSVVSISQDALQNSRLSHSGLAEAVKRVGRSSHDRQRGGKSTPGVSLYPGFDFAGHWIVPNRLCLQHLERMNTESFCRASRPLLPCDLIEWLGCFVFPLALRSARQPIGGNLNVVAPAGTRGLPPVASN